MPDTTEKENHASSQHSSSSTSDIREDQSQSSEKSSSSSESPMEIATATPETGPLEDDMEAGDIPFIELPAVPPTEKTRTRTTNNNTDDIDIEKAIAVVEPEGGAAMRLEDLESTPIAQLVPNDDTEQFDADPEEDNTTTTTQQQQNLLERRPEFVSATVHKPEESTPMGMGLASQDGEVLISSIAPDSLVSKTPFQVGDRLLSVNAKRCYIMDSKAVAQFMATLVGNVTIVVHNKTGDPHLVESMVTKPTLDTRCGLGLKSDGRRNLKISNIDHDGLFFESLLNVGDPLVSINGDDCRHCDAHDAGEIIARAGRFITIKAQTLMETGVVVAEFSCNNSTGSTIAPPILAALRQIENLNPSTAQLMALTLMAVALVGLVLITGLL